MRCTQCIYFQLKAPLLIALFTAERMAHVAIIGCYYASRTHPSRWQTFEHIILGIKFLHITKSILYILALIYYHSLSIHQEQPG